MTRLAGSDSVRSFDFKDDLEEGVIFLKILEAFRINPPDLSLSLSLSGVCVGASGFL